MLKPLLSLYFKNPRLYFVLIALCIYYFVTPDNPIQSNFYIGFAFFMLFVYIVRSVLVASVEASILKHRQKVVQGQKRSSLRGDVLRFQRLWRTAFALYSVNFIFLIPLRLVIAGTGFRFLIALLALASVSYLTAKRLDAKDILGVPHYAWLHIRVVVLALAFPLSVLLLIITLVN